MLDAQSRVLYVGKARALKKRVSNYAKPTGHSPRIARMIRETASMMFLTTRTETEALLLEQNLIKQLKPKYNVLLRDDKSFPNILVSQAHPFPQIKKHRGAKKEKGAYFGPFASAGAVNRTLNQLQKVFLLRNCSDACSTAARGPACSTRSSAAARPASAISARGGLRGLRRDAVRFLSRATRPSCRRAGRADGGGAEAMEFERAAALRDRIRALTNVQSAQGINPRGVGGRCHRAAHGGRAGLRAGVLHPRQPELGQQGLLPPRRRPISAPEVLEAFLGQFYDQKDPPRQLILSHPIENADLMAEALSQKLGRKVEILVPQRGEKAELVDGALRNARESLARKMAEGQAQAKLLAGWRRRSGSTPRRAGSRSTTTPTSGHQRGGRDDRGGARGLRESQYRKFNIRATDLTPGDDFGMMKEVLTRRFQRLLKEDPDRETEAWPDLC
jgi:excinuclease ABC subunit C